MKFCVFSAVVLAAALGLSGCKLVKTDVAESQAEASGPGGDDARIAQLLAESYDSKLVPAVRSKAVDFPIWKAAVAEGLDKAGEAYGVRAGGAGGSWIFALKGSGKIVEEDRKSKAATAAIDIDGDGQADATLQLGPVVKGTAVRDMVPEIYDFSSFRDQIEFAKLGRALNQKAVSALPLGDASLSGKTVSFVGAASIRSAKDLPQIVPVVWEAGQ